MTDQQPGRVATPACIVAALRELIVALDRRVPRVGQMGEIRIARDAAILRSHAVTRIEELKPAGSERHGYDRELVEAIMTDDGGPSPERVRPVPRAEGSIAAESSTGSGPSTLPWLRS